jgi:hypothetical protein
MHQSFLLCDKRLRKVEKSHQRWSGEFFVDFYCFDLLELTANFKTRRGRVNYHLDAKIESCYVHEQKGNLYTEGDESEVKPGDQSVPGKPVHRTIFS